MPHSVTSLKASDVVLIVDETFAHTYTINLQTFTNMPLRTFEKVPINTKIKLERIDSYENVTGNFWFMFNGNYCHTFWLNAVRCKDIAHDPKECKSCEFLNKGCIK